MTAADVKTSFKLTFSQSRLSWIKCAQLVIKMSLSLVSDLQCSDVFFPRTSALVSD